MLKKMALNLLIFFSFTIVTSYVVGYCVGLSGAKNICEASFVVKTLDYVSKLGSGFLFYPFARNLLYFMFDISK